MDDLTRFAWKLAERLGADGEGPLRPVSVATIRGQLLPYRTHRSALGLESMEDYESVLLRLVAEEGGYVRTQPMEAAERCRQVLQEPNPDLGVLDEVAESTIQLTSIAAGRIVADEPPPAPAPAPVEPPREEVAPPPPTPQPAPAMSSNACPHCQQPTPAGRAVVFCPWCGQRLVPFACPRCRTELDSAWRHCITCGAEVKDPHRYP